MNAKKNAFFTIVSLRDAKVGALIEMISSLIGNGSPRTQSAMNLKRFGDWASRSARSAEKKDCASEACWNTIPEKRFPVSESMPKRMQTTGPSWMALEMSERVMVEGMLRMRTTRACWERASWIMGLEAGREGMRPMLLRRRPERGVEGCKSTFRWLGEALLTMAAQVETWVLKAVWVGVGVRESEGLDAEFSEMESKWVWVGNGD